MTDPAALAGAVHLAAHQLDLNKVTPGLLGFVIFAALGAATWFLVKSMNRQFHRVNFTEQPEQPQQHGGKQAPERSGGPGDASRTARPAAAASKDDAGA